ncbi:MAG: hypothetical protein NW220_21905 [Leptolyngbyaceae cyanobacterium bins.349]|nr:hypothetical protein [Leptolyngbyaceae cyanobacterium bins.349]
MSSLTLPQMNGSSVSRPSDGWLQSSVQELFSGFNWDGHTPEIYAATQSSPDLAEDPFSPEMSVGRFFASIHWEGGAIAAPSPIESGPPPSKTEFTLDDFSDLF